MFKEVKIGNITVPMLANGATPLRYKMIFHKDLISEFQDATENAEKAMESLPELAFIMAMQAQNKEVGGDLNLLNEDRYMKWMEQFDPMDIPMASDEIVGLYTGNMETSSEPKKKEKKN